VLSLILLKGGPGYEIYPKYLPLLKIVGSHWKTLSYT